MSDGEDNWSQDNYGDEGDDFEAGYLDEDSDLDMQGLIKREEQFDVDRSFDELNESSSEESDDDLDLDLSDLEEEEQIKKVQTILEEPQIKNEERITSPYLSKYEKAAVLGKRAMQISKNSPIYVYLTESEKKTFSPLDIAEKELMEKKLPFIIRRPLPNGEYEQWKLQELNR